MGIKIPILKKYYFRHKRYFIDTIFAVMGGNINDAYRQLEQYFKEKFNIDINSDGVKTITVEEVNFGKLDVDILAKYIDAHKKYCVGLCEVGGDA